MSAVHDDSSTESNGQADGLRSSADEESLVFESRASAAKRGAIYCRSWSSTREAVEKALLEVYGRSAEEHSAFIFCSGMAAIGATMSSLARPNQKRTCIMVCGNELYSEVPRLVQHLVEEHAPFLRAVSFDIRDAAGLKRFFKEHGKDISLFHFEACTNPSGQLFDFALIPELRAEAPECVFVADNTWLTGILLNPLDLGVDIVVESMTKYVSAGRCIGGAVIGKDSVVAKILTWIKVFGHYVAADHCRLFLDGIHTMPQRVCVASASAEQAACYLQEHTGVTRVLYPSLASHPTHAHALQYLRGGGPGCLWFHVAATENVARQALALPAVSSVIELKTSFGGRAARVDPWPRRGASTDYDVPVHEAADQEQEQLNEGGAKNATALRGTWLRLAMGYEQDLDEVLKALDMFLAHLQSTSL